MKLNHMPAHPLKYWQSLCGRAKCSCSGWRRTKLKVQKGLPTEIWGRGMVAATIAAPSGEPTLYPPRVTQETRVITGTLGGREGGQADYG